MSLLEQASLVITPNAYKENILYSVIPNTTLGDMDVVRATTATRVNSAGLIELVPYNLLTYSEQFDNAAYTKQNVTITANATTSPDGTANADRMFETAISGNHGLFQSINLSTATNYAVSCFVKKGNRDYCGLQFFYNAGNGTIAFFNLLNGTLIYEFAEGAGYSITNSNITNVGNGWYRLSATVQVGHIDSAPGIVLASTQWSTGTSYDNAYLGDVTKYVDLWGLQCEQGSTAKDYLRTETRLNIPRLDYTNGSCPSLLIEPQRTNIALYSEQFDNAAWDKFGTALTVTSNNVISPDGTQNADTLNVSNNNNTLYQVRTGTFVGNTYTFSLYAKGSGNFTMNIRLNSSTTTTETKTLTSQWQRFNVTVTNAVPVIAIEFYIDLNTSSTYNIWGAQLEQGSYPTSYIPTVASTVTRNADVISKTGISSLIGQTEGTIFVEEIYDATVLNSGGLDDTLISLTDGTSNNLISIFHYGGGLGSILFFIRLSNTTQVAISSSKPTSGTYKIALAYKNNDVVGYINGVQIGTDTSATIPATSVVTFYDPITTNSATKTVNIKSAQVYKTRLTNAELAQLTTI